MKVYPELDPSTLEPYYCRHVQAMTAEGLHEKSDIAVQLAARDAALEDMRALYKGVLAENEQIRAVGGLSAWERLDLETIVQNEHKLYADAHEKWQQAEARVRELEAERDRLKADLKKEVTDDMLRLHVALGVEISAYWSEVADAAEAVQHEKQAYFNHWGSVLEKLKAAEALAADSDARLAKAGVLVEQWRAEAVQVAHELASASIGTQYGVKVTLQECANELRAALASQTPAARVALPTALAAVAESLPVSEDDERIVSEHMAKVTAGRETRPLERKAPAGQAGEEQGDG